MTVAKRCAVCGAQHSGCGPSTTVIPIGDNVTRRKEEDVALKRYEVDLGKGRIATLQLNDEDAKRYGVFEKKAAAPAANKARKPQNKAAKPAADKASQKPAEPTQD